MSHVLWAGKKFGWMNEHWDVSTPESGDQSVCNKAATEGGYGVVTAGGWLHEVCCGWGGALVLVLHCRCGGTCRNIK
jgi:hypothetical protein